jgi:uncharacterized membrane protein
MIQYAIPYILLSIFLIWSIYNGDVYPHEGGMLAAIFIGLNVICLLLKLPSPAYIVTFVIVLIYLIVRVYAGDVKIR